RRTRGLDLPRPAEWRPERGGVRWRAHGLIVVVLQIAAEARTAFDVEDDAGIDRTRVDVHADGALVPLGEVLDPVNRLCLVDRIQRTARDAKLRAEVLHLDAGGSGETVHAHYLLVLGAITVDLLVVLDDELPFDHRHPAELAVVRVKWRDRAGGPADHHRLDHVVAEDFVARVALGEPHPLTLGGL